jgi:hypothetical protein
MKNLIAVCSFLFFGSGLFAQNYGEIHGRIMDYHTGESLPFATVSTSFADQIIATVADEDGRFRLKPLQPGKYSLEFSYLGYNRRTLTEIEVTPGKIFVLGEVSLSTDNELPVVEIAAYKLIDMDLPNVEVMKAKDIRHNAFNKNPSLMITTITPEIKLSEDGLFEIRGSRPGTSATFLDGVRITGPLSNIASSAIKSITVHTGGIPAKYGDITGGIVVVETKSYFDYFYEANR